MLDIEGSCLSGKSIFLIQFCFLFFTIRNGLNKEIVKLEYVSSFHFLETHYVQSILKSTEANQRQF